MAVEIVEIKKYKKKNEERDFKWTAVPSLGTVVPFSRWKLISVPVTKFVEICREINKKNRDNEIMAQTKTLTGYKWPQMRTDSCVFRYARTETDTNTQKECYRYT